MTKGSLQALTHTVPSPFLGTTVLPLLKRQANS